MTSVLVQATDATIEMEDGPTIEMVGGSGLSTRATYIRNVPIATTVPAVGEALVFDGTSYTPTAVATGAALDGLTVMLNNHLADVANPHAVTKAQVGLGNVENTALTTWGGSGNITTVGTLVAGAVPASLLTGSIAYARFPSAEGTWVLADPTSSVKVQGCLEANTVGTGAGAAFRVDADIGLVCDFSWRKAGLGRWLLRCNATAESGASAGSDFQMFARTDNGGILDTPLTIIRAAGGRFAITRPFLRTELDTTLQRADVANPSSSTGAVHTPGIQALGNASGEGTISVIRGTTGVANGAGLVLGKINSGNSALAAVTAVATGHVLGTIAWVGTDGTDLGTIAGAIRCTVEGTVTTSRIPGKMELLLAAGAANDDLAVVVTWLPTSATFVGTVITAASVAARAGLRVPHGTAPSAPVNGDMWTTTAGLFVRLNGVTRTVNVT